MMIGVSALLGKVDEGHEAEGVGDDVGVVHFGPDKCIEPDQALYKAPGLSVHEPEKPLTLTLGPQYMRGPSLSP